MLTLTTALIRTRELLLAVAVIDHPNDLFVFGDNMI